MRKFVIIALATFGLVLLSSLPPATAKVKGSESYTWSFARVGSDRVVCKKIDTVLEKHQPQLQTKQAVHIRSTIVSDRYCANSGKPAI